MINADTGIDSFGSGNGVRGRAGGCGGLMIPISAEPDPKKGYIITHKCTKCGAIKRNKAATEAKIQPDDISLIIKLTVAK